MIARSCIYVWLITFVALFFTSTFGYTQQSKNSDSANVRKWAISAVAKVDQRKGCYAY